MIRGVIFDADGTLIDSMQAWADVGVRYLAQRGIVADADLPAIMFHRSLEEGASHIKARYGLPESVAELRAEMLALIASFFENEVALKPGARETIDTLRRRGIPLTVATSGKQEFLVAALRRLGVLDAFCGIFTCTDHNTTKHESAIYDLAAAHMGTAPQETAVFEDVLYCVQTAKAAGYYVVAVEDAASVSQREAIRHAADLYTADYTDLDAFWAQIPTK